MGYRFQRKESIAQGTQRIASEQLHKAIAELGAAELALPEKIHQVRKRFKKIRALARLVRPALGENYQSINTYYRDLGLRLSGLRDAEARAEMVHKLCSDTDSTLPSEHLLTVVETLVREREEMTAQWPGLEQELDTIKTELELAVVAIPGCWRLSGKPKKRVFQALRKTYTRGRQALEDCLSNPEDEQWHEWRKRAKSHWYHVRLVENSWQSVMKSRARDLKILSDLLGDDHDIGVLLGHIHRRAGQYPDISSEALDTLNQRALSRRAWYRSEAVKWGRRVYLDNPGELKQRLQKIWNVWKNA